MKQLLLFLAFVLLHTTGRAQNIDSFFRQPQTIELEVSTPQPRLKETFQITLDINHIKANIFKSLIAKFEQAEEIGSANNDQLIMNLHTLKKGKNEIGPLEITIDKTKYTTNKVSFEVIDPLPDTDRGLWFRKVMTSDSTFCILIEQRIPASSRQTIVDDHTTSYTTEPETREIARFKNSYSIEGLSSRHSSTTTNFSSITDSQGDDREFMYGYSVYYFTIEDRQAKIKITADKFDNLPAGYRFEDIIVQ